jgi:predicted transport protein
MSRCRYILGQLENWDNKSVVSLDNVTIEHIIPQNPQLSTDWISTLGSDWSETHKKYLHTIGNLTLTTYNSEMSDSSFTEKLNMPGGFKESALRLNKYVVSQTMWGKAQVNERAAQLGEIAIKVWPYPTLSYSELAPYRKRDDSVSQYSLESYDQLNAYNRILFEMLNKRILNLGTYVKQGFTKTYVSYKVDTIIAAIFFQKDKLRICIGLPIEEIFDPKSLCRLNNNWNPAGNAEMFLDSLDNLDDVTAIIEQAFRLQDIE